MQLSVFGKEIDVRRRQPGLIHVKPVNVGTGGRVMSTLGGAGLVLFGLSRGSVGGVLLALLGGSFLFRGVTGHCEFNEAVGRNTVGGRKWMRSATLQRMITFS